MTTKRIVQEFDHYPTLDELCSWVDPGVSMMLQRIVETPEKLRLVPAPIPMWFVLLVLSVPAGGLAWFGSQGDLGQIGTVPSVLLAILIIVGFGAIFFALNKATMSQPDCFVLHKDTRVLELPLFGVTLPREEIAEMIEVSGWHRSGGDSTLGFEMSVLQQVSDDCVIRYPLKAIMSDVRIARTVRALPKALDVRLQRKAARNKGSCGANR